VFEGLDYPHDLSHDLSERTVYIPSTSLCCYNQQRAITLSDHGVLVAESLTKDSLFAAIQQRLSGMSNIINCGTPAGTPSDGPEMRMVIDWADEMWDAIGVAGLAMEKAYGNFEDPAKMDADRYYGVDTAGRLRAVKKQYDPKDAFYKGYPKLA
jgi:hypothetical protein